MRTVANPRCHTSQLLPATVRCESAPCGEMRDVDIQRCAVDLYDRFDHRARLAFDRKVVHFGGEDMAARQNRVAESAARFAETRTEKNVEARRGLQLLRLVVE